MNTTEAMQKIDEINEIIQSSNKYVFSGERMIVYGLMVAFIPLIEFATKNFTFGNDYLANADFLVTVIHTGFYWTLFVGAGRLMPWRTNKENLHPLIVKAFSVNKPLLVALFGVLFVFSAIKEYQLIHPVVFLLLGLMFSIYGRFSIPAVSYIAWSYIIGGLGYAYLTRFEIPHLWVCFTIYNGLSYIAMGYFLRGARKAA